MTTSENRAPDPHPPEFDRFLHASVGEDRNGSGVTVLSTLARLGLDPWCETAELAMSGREAARARLGLLLSRFRDVPSLGQDHGTVARELSLLLPEPPSRRPPANPGGGAGPGTRVSGSTILTVLAILFALLLILFENATG